MINSLNVLLPEIFLTLSIFVILMLGVFLKKSFNIVFNLSLIIIVITIVIIFNSSNNIEKIFLDSFIKDNFSSYFKILILISSFLVLNSSKVFIVDAKINKFGNFVNNKLQGEAEESSPRIPFGTSDRNWNDMDEIAPISNIGFKSPYLLIDTKLSISKDGTSEDISGNENLGLAVGDYRIQFGNGRLPERDEVIIESKNKNEEKAF